MLSSRVAIFNVPESKFVAEFLEIITFNLKEKNFICLNHKSKVFPKQWSDRVEIIAAATVKENMPENDEDVNVEDTVQTPKISHSEELKGVETAL
ncbi:hypothetical protein TNCV_4070021 [Trichonephila clavipes]|nr:hypothetical protein TNCV_4070021 [Trichonephila clavipes]